MTTPLGEEPRTYEMTFPTAGGGAEELSHRGVSGTGSNADGDSVTLHTLACQGNRDHAGRLQPPPPTVTPVRHAGDLEGSERVACCHR